MKLLSNINYKYINLILVCIRKFYFDKKIVLNKVGYICYNYSFLQN